MRGTGRHEVTLRRRVRANRVLQNLLRAGVENDVLGFDLVLRRDRVDEVGVGRGAVERIPVRFRELAEDRIERDPARAERVFVAVDADFLDARRQHRTAARARRLLFGVVRLQAARGDERARKCLLPAPDNS